MNKSLSELIFADCLFILFLSVSGIVGGAFGTFFYAIAFILPVMILVLRWRRGEREIYKIPVLSPPSSSLHWALFTFPTVFIILLISFVTAMLMGALGIEGAAGDLDGNLMYIITIRALAPAIFEEMLFRYLPIRALAGHSPRLAVIYSALLFAFSHCNLFQIPYALFAGVVFVALDIAYGSILPSIIIHFINNLLSILWQRNCDEGLFCAIFLSAIVVFTLISVALICLNRKKIKEAFSAILKDKSKVIFTYTLKFYILATFIAAISTLLI